MPEFYIDGQSLGNQQKTLPRQAKIAVAFREKPTSAFQLHWEEIGDRTNNEAEYYALIKALNMILAKWPELGAAATRKGVEPVKVYSDSLLIVNQVKGVYEATDTRLKSLCDNAKALMKKLGSVKLEWVSREGNYAGQWIEDKWKGGKVEVIKDGQPGETVVAKV
jgi:ribonuclease HI